MFSGILVSKDVLLEISFSDIKLPCCYRELGEMKSVKMFIWKYPKHFSKNLGKMYLEKNRMYS